MADQAPPMKGVIPYITVDGADKASAFYQQAFGAVEAARMAAPDNPEKIIHLHMVINGGSLMMSDPFPEHGHGFSESPSITMTLVVEDGEAWWNRAVEAGCTVVMPFQKMFWGDRYGSLKDPFQINWAINEATAAQ